MVFSAIYQIWIFLSQAVHIWNWIADSQPTVGTVLKAALGIFVLWLVCSWVWDKLCQLGTWTAEKRGIILLLLFSMVTIFSGVVLIVGFCQEEDFCVEKWRHVREMANATVSLPDTQITPHP